MTVNDQDPYSVETMDADPEETAEWSESLSALVAERGPQGTTLTRLDADKLKPWLENYRLGQLWTRGEIGGTRW